TVDTNNGIGMPCSGNQYARVVANGPFTVPAGGPAPNPPGGVTNQLLIPIPPNTLGVSFCWDFYDAEGGGGFFNDGMSIDLIGPGCGPSLANLVYVDDATVSIQSGFDNGNCGSFGLDTVAPGPQIYGPSPLPAGAQYIRVMVWNGGDDAVASHGVIDDVLFYN